VISIFTIGGAKKTQVSITSVVKAEEERN